MKRREFIRWLGPATALATFGPSVALPVFAGTSGYKRLIVVFQRGGCDGLNSVVPYGDDDYYNLRPGLAIAPPGASGSGKAVSIDHDLFALHPALAPLVPIYLQGSMAILPSVHYTGAQRSHFASQQTVEEGFTGLSNNGWLNRYLQQSQGSGQLPAVSIGTLIADSLRGPIPVPVLNHINNANWLNDALLASLGVMYAQNVGSEPANRFDVYANGRLMLDHQDDFAGVLGETYTPANGAVYPDSLFGAHLMLLAQIIKSGLGLEIATVDSPGWDTHREQGAATGNQAERLAEFAGGIAALYADLGPTYMQDTLILTMTEFGRTARENASGGTDHGHASAWYAIGGGVIGGVHGVWPGLGESSLEEGRYLAQTVDCRDVFCEVIARHFGQGASLGAVMPGHVYNTIGFL